ncbi:MAG TPA: hypothetical protein DHW42_09920 [Candidatus Marinimicrobia bacterium]|nr:hypothetical protein [Candidatus Neomarinimicrobiota bacterium]
MKYNKIINLLLFTVFLLLFCCKPNSPLNNKDNILTVSPDHGTIGTKVKIFGRSFEDNRSAYTLMFSNASDWIRPDSILNDTIYACVPFTATSGPIEIVSATGSLIVEDFTISNYSLDEIVICWSDLNYQITKEMSSITWTPENPKTWTVEKIADTIKVFGEHHPGDYSTYHRLTLLDKGSGNIPEIISACTVYKPDYPDSTIYLLERGILKIQDWDIDGIICGRLFSDPWKFNNYSFWHNFKNESD